MATVTLPQNLVDTPVVAFTFDDAYLSTYEVAYLYMHPRNIPGTFYVRTANVNGATRIKSTHLRMMHVDGWTIANHTRAHINLTTLALADIENQLNWGRADLQAWGISGNGPSHVAYPFCAYNATVLTAMANTGMLTGRICDIGYPTLPFADPYIMTVGIGLDGYVPTTLEQARAWIDGVVANNRLGIAIVHDLVDDPDEPYEWAISDFEALIDYTVASQVPIATIDEIYRVQSGPVTARTGDEPGYPHRGATWLHLAGVHEEA